MQLTQVSNAFFAPMTEKMGKNSPKDEGNTTNLYMSK